MNVPGPKILNMGQPGMGKTYSIRSLIECGVTPFVIFTEQSMSTLGDLPPEKCHWRYIRPRPTDIEAMITFATKVNTLSVKALADVRDANMGDYRQFIELLKTLAEFTCDRTGEVFGPVDNWGPGRCLILDGLTGVNKMCLDLVTGGRPIRSQPEWGVAIDNEQRFLDHLVNVPCSVIVNAHLEPERDEVTGRVMQFASAIGRKLGPILPGSFGEVVQSYRIGNDFYWNAASDEVATKQRLLPLKDKLPQDYALVFDPWQEKGGELTELWDK